jgi:hypothetical protein
MKENTTGGKKIQYTRCEYSLLKRHDQTKGETADDYPRRFSIKNYLIIGRAFLGAGTHKRGLSRQQKAQREALADIFPGLATELRGQKGEEVQFHKWLLERLVSRDVSTIGPTPDNGAVVQIALVGRC